MLLIQISYKQLYMYTERGREYQKEEDNTLKLLLNTTCFLFEENDKTFEFVKHVSAETSVIFS